MPGKRILSVGQCAADHGSIARAVVRHFDAQVVPVDTSDEALNRLRDEAFDLVLVNRVFDADGDSGVKLVQQIKAEEPIRQVPVMLVSNYDDAQREAVQAGAVHGFGKAALGDPQTIDRLKTYLD
jgi:CheY-like chemotaxis protein